MKSFRIALMLCIYVLCQNNWAQESTNYWLFGLGVNAVDDTGIKLRQYFDVDDNWNIVPYPSRVSAGYFLENGFGFEFVGSYNKYKVGKIIDGVPNPEEKDYVGLDAKISYDLNKIIGQTGWFDPYIATGAGYTWVGNNERPTFNVGAGFNTWFNDRWGLNFNTVGKIALKDDASNHAQHSIGVVFKLQAKKQIINEEEIVAVEEVVIEEPKDSIVEVKIDEEAAKRASEEMKRQQMIKELNDIGTVYFKFNSSYLTQEAKNILDRLVEFMNKYPDANIDSGAHADVRGTDAYNIWLTERRAKRVADYIISKGIGADRINANGYGESQIVNRCANGVKCTEEEHQQNRRSNFKLKEN